MIGADVPRDSQRQVQRGRGVRPTLFDRVNAHGSPTVEFFGICADAALKVGSVRKYSVQRVDDVLSYRR